jgi:hypothetical protein
MPCSWCQLLFKLSRIHLPPRAQSNLARDGGVFHVTKRADPKDTRIRPFLCSPYACSRAKFQLLYTLMPF